MSTIKADNITWRTGEATANSQYTVTADKIVWGTSKAWTQCIGSTPSITGSFNLSSITKNATGDCSVSFSASFPDTKYSAGAIGTLDEGSSPAIVSCVTISRTTGQLVGSFRFQTYYWASSSNGIADFSKICLSFFR